MIQELLKNFEQALEILNDSRVATIYFRVKIITLVLSSLFLIALIIILIKSIPYLKESWLGTFRGTDVPTFPKSKMYRKWKVIQKRMQTGQDSNYKLAVIEADKILDNILESAGFPGKNMGERLQNMTSAHLSNLEDILEAHELRNKIVNNMELELEFSQAEQAIKAYSAALDELEAI